MTESVRPDLASLDPVPDRSRRAGASQPPSPARDARHVERQEAVVPHPAQVGREHVAQVGDAILEHGDAVEPHAEGEALVALRIEPAVADHVRVHHAGAEDLEPAAGLADRGGVDVDLHRRLGEREVRGAEAHLDVVDLEERLAELLQRPLQVAEVGRLVDDQSLDLVEHRRVRRITVDAIDAARRDDADRRLLRQHRADLHGARVRAQQHALVGSSGLQIERVVILPGGMLGRDIELGEIEVVGLDVRPLGHREAHVGEDLDDLVEHLAHGMNAAFGQWPQPHRQRHVGTLGGQPCIDSGGVEHSLAGLECGLHGFLGFVDRCAESLAALRRLLADLGHKSGHGAALAECGHPHLVEFRQIGSAGDVRQEL